jgi:hypothetical protein
LKLAGDNDQPWPIRTQIPETSAAEQIVQGAT